MATRSTSATREELTSLRQEIERLRSMIPAPDGNSVSTRQETLKIVEMTTLQESSWLTGFPHESSNNWDTFSYELPSHFSELDLWDIETNTPLVSCSARMILKNFSPSLQVKYRNILSASDLWTTVCKDYAGKTLLNQARLIKDISKSQLPTDMEAAFLKYESILRSMTSAFGDNISTQYLVQLLFVQQLPADYDTQRIQTQSNNELDFEELRKLVLAKWRDIASKGKKALLTTDMCSNHRKPLPCYQCKPCPKCTSAKKNYTWHAQDSPRCQRNYESAPPKSTPPKSSEPASKPAISPAPPSHQANLVFAVDSGATAHVLGNKDSFDLYLPSDIHLTSANGDIIPVHGQGTVSLSPNVSLDECIHAPTVNTNLLSVSRFDDEGKASLFIRGSFYLCDAALLDSLLGTIRTQSYLTGVKRNGLYEVCTEKVNLVRTPNRSSVQWHRTLNHASSKRITLTSKMVAGLGLPRSGVETPCVPCAESKSTQQPYSGTYLVPHRRGHTISADTWHATMEDNNGNKYYCVFIDHFTLKSWIYLFSKKSELEDITLTFLKNLSNDIGSHPAIFHPDGEGGFVSSRVKAYLKSNGTTLQTSLPECHQQNGLVENYHRHAANGIRSLLSQAKLPETFWGEAALYYNHVRNKMHVTGRK